MKKIAIICNSLVGLMSFRKELLEKLIEKKYNVTVVAPEYKFSKDLKKMGIKFIPVEMESRGTNPIKDLKLILTYKKILKLNKPDIVLTYTIKPNVYGGIVCRILKIPYIVNVTGLGSSVENTGLIQKITLSLYKIGLKNAKCVFFQNSENLEFMLRRKIVKKDYKLIPGSGVNIEKHKVLPYPNNDKITFLFISRIIYEKGIEEYLKAAENIKEKYPNTEFHILGQCDDKKYKEQISNLENKNIVIYHGQVDDVAKYHKISNCTIHPSFYPEGMSNVLLESCALGRPIITTNRAGCKEIVEDGINGYQIEIKDTNALIQKIEDFINLTHEEKKQMGLEGRKKVEKEFNRKIVINEYVKQINK